MDEREGEGGSLCQVTVAVFPAASQAGIRIHMMGGVGSC
jgi:vancomycin resistance protein YoaR